MEFIDAVGTVLIVLALAALMMLLGALCFEPISIDAERARIIKAQGFCVKSKKAGINFEKCYDVVERK